MDPLEYERMYHFEDQHWWYQGMEAITRATLDRLVTPRTELRILDAGCGTGAAMSTYLKEYGRVTGIDISQFALKYCRARKLPSLALASVMAIPFQPGCFDLVSSFDVLYERAVNNEITALAEFYRVLRLGGFLLLRLPAYDWLRGHHDFPTHTARRFTASKVSELLRESGFNLIHISYANTFLFPLAATKRLLERFFPPAPNSSDLSVDVGIFSGLFKWVLSREAPIVARHGLSFGLSIIAVGQKPVNP
jgi:ubiquinone/menaquinone biosynthesis C-methylase UbiE